MHPPNEYCSQVTPNRRTGISRGGRGDGFRAEDAENAETANAASGGRPLACLRRTAPTRSIPGALCALGDLCARSDFATSREIHVSAGAGH